MKLFWCFSLLCSNFLLVASFWGQRTISRNCPAGCRSEIKSVEKAIQEQNQASEEKLNQTRSELKNAISKLKADLKSEIYQLQNESKSDHCNRLKTENKGLKNDIAKLEQVIANLNNTLNNLTRGNE
ncbi:Hypothetical predicted protein, partial [Paramuricea clavata]